jgi:hypothetical protein
LSTEEAAPQLVPFLKSRFAIERIHLELASRPRESAEDGLEQELALRIPYIPIAEHYAMGLVYDHGDTASIVRQDLLNKWDMQFNEGLTLAFANLSDTSAYPFELVAPGVYMAGSKLDHNPAKLLLTDRVTNLNFRGLPVAIIPHANQVVITGSEDMIGLKLMLKITKDLVNGPNGVMSLPMVLSENNWCPFSVAGDHELFDEFDGLRLSVMSAMYTEQKSFLEKIYARGEKHFSIVEYLGRTIDDSVFSQAIVNEHELPILLPLADSLEFRRMEENSPLKRVATGNLDRCVKAIFDLLVPVGLYPERCKLEKFPDKKQLRAIGNDGFTLEYERFIAPAADPKKVVEDVLLLPIYPNSRPKGDSKEHQGRFTMNFLTTDPTADVSKFYFEAINKSVSTCVFNYQICKSAVLEQFTAASQTLMSQMLAAHYNGRIPSVVLNPMPTPDTYLISDDTQTVSRTVSLIRAQHNGTVIMLSKKAYSPEAVEMRKALPINDLPFLASVIGIPIHESLTPAGPCLNETHTISQLFKVAGASLQDLALFYLTSLRQGGYLTSTSGQCFIEAITPTESISVHLGKGIAGEPFMQVKRKKVSNVNPTFKKGGQLLDLETRLGVELYPDCSLDGKLFIKERISEQKFVTGDNPQAVARYFRSVMPEPIFIPLEDHKPNCWMVQSFAARKPGESLAVLVMAGAERTQFVVRATR